MRRKSSSCGETRACTLPVAFLPVDCRLAVLRSLKPPPWSEPLPIHPDRGSQRNDYSDPRRNWPGSTHQGQRFRPVRVRRLAIGHYNIKAEASGFGVAQKNDVVLNVGDRARIDFDMKMGAATENITVEADAVRVQSESGEVSSRHHRSAGYAARHQRSQHVLLVQPNAGSFQPAGRFSNPNLGWWRRQMSFNGLRESQHLSD